jgi:hypothetical protein
MALEIRQHPIDLDAIMSNVIENIFKLIGDRRYHWMMARSKANMLVYLQLLIGVMTRKNVNLAMLVHNNLFSICTLCLKYVKNMYQKMRSAQPIQFVRERYAIILEIIVI